MGQANAHLCTGRGGQAAKIPDGALAEGKALPRVLPSSRNSIWDHVNTFDTNSEEVRLTDIVLSTAGHPAIPLSPGFDESLQSYAAVVPYSCDSIDLAVFAHPNTQIELVLKQRTTQVLRRIHAANGDVDTGSPRAASPTVMAEESRATELDIYDEELDQPVPAPTLTSTSRTSHSSRTSLTSRSSRTSLSTDTNGHGTHVYYELSGLVSGENAVEIHVTAEGLKNTVFLVIGRKPWDKKAWYPGTNRDKYRWYLRGAMDGNAAAQYHLALMYVGEDGAAYAKWESEDKESGELLSPRDLRSPPLSSRVGSDLGDSDYLTDATDSSETDFRVSPSRPRRRASNEMGILVWVDDSDATDTQTEDEKRLRIPDSRRKEEQSLHHAWLTQAAQKGYMPALYRIANLYYTNAVPRHILELEIVKEPSDESSTRIANRHTKHWDLVGFCKQKAAYWFQTAAGQGDRRAAYQLAQMYIDGIGVRMDFQRGRELFEQAGVGQSIVQQLIDKKFLGLKPRYKALFQTHDADGDGAVCKNEFQLLYRDMLCALHGLARKDAYSQTATLVQGKPFIDAIFATYDDNRDGVVTFEEVWGHPHTASTLVPKNEAQLALAERFFRKWSFRRRSQSHVLSLDRL